MEANSNPSAWMVILRTVLKVKTSVQNNPEESNLPPLARESEVMESEAKLTVMLSRVAPEMKRPRIISPRLSFLSSTLT